MNGKRARAIIESAYSGRTSLAPETADRELRGAVEFAVELLDRGEARVAEPVAGGWKVNEWLKMAVLLRFRIGENHVFELGDLNGYDKNPLKYSGYGSNAFARERVRVVPPATVRKGAYVGPDVVLMPCYVNIGAYLGAGTMVDTWATVGSCAQVGERVHLSGGAGIGGVLEPLQAAPTVIEDDCFVGARAEIVEGVIVERGAVIAMGVFIGASTRIYDRETGEITRGRVPAGAVVVPGALPAADGSHSLACAVIVKRVDEQTRARVGVNALLRDASRQ